MYEHEEDMARVKGTRIAPRTIQVVLGEREAVPEDLEEDELLLRIAMAVDSGDDLPFMLDPVVEAYKNVEEKERKQRARMALVRVQVDAEVRQREEFQASLQRKYAAETLEKILFGYLTLKTRRKKRRKSEENEDGE